MKKTLDAFIARFLVHWVDAVRRHARAVVTGTAATDRAGDVIVRKKGTWDDGPV